MGPNTITVNSRKYDSSIRRSWQCELIEHVDDGLVLVGVFETAVSHPDLGLIKPGTVSHEYYWLNRWYNIFRFHGPDGTFRNYYCNINMPPVFESGVLDYIDLDIDVVVWPDSTYQVLDLAEYEANAANFAYPKTIRSRVSETLSDLVAMIEAGELPFAK